MKNWKNAEAPKVGDVCRMADWAFGTCVVTAVLSNGTVCLARPHAMITVAGAFATMTETFEVCAEKFATAFEIATTGPSGATDNVARS